MTQPMIDDTHEARPLVGPAVMSVATGPIIGAAVSKSSSHVERIRSIDALRGFALLGILIVNIQSFAMVEAAYFNPKAYGELTGANRWVWLRRRMSSLTRR